MEDLNWRTGPAAAAQTDFPDMPEEEGDKEFWKSLLSNQSLRSRFIRNLEIQSIGSRSTEDLLHRVREEEIIPRGGTKR